MHGILRPGLKPSRSRLTCLARGALMAGCRRRTDEQRLRAAGVEVAAMPGELQDLVEHAFAPG
jgi:hypothetical protein